jgi:hypothetical protein
MPKLKNRATTSAKTTTTTTGSETATFCDSMKVMKVRRPLNLKIKHDISIKQSVYNVNYCDCK